MNTGLKDLDEKLLKKVVVMGQLEDVFKNIAENQDIEFNLCKEVDSSVTAQSYIKEVLEIGEDNKEIEGKILEIQQYYDCDKRLAILLFRFTDAYMLMQSPLKNNK